MDTTKGTAVTVELLSFFPGSYPGTITGHDVDGFGRELVCVKLDRNPNPHGDAVDASGESWRNWRVPVDQISPLS